MGTGSYMESRALKLTAILDSSNGHRSDELRVHTFEESWTIVWTWQHLADILVRAASKVVNAWNLNLDRSNHFDELH